MIDEIVLATTVKPEDDPLAILAGEYAISVFRGSENDLVDRYYQATLQFGADIIVRVPADNPVPEPAEVDRTIQHHLNSSNDFTTSYPDVLDNGWPDGIGAEVFNFEALKRVWETSTDPRNREHPHTNFYEHPELFRVGTLPCPQEFRRPDIKLDVNTRQEYEFMAALYDFLYFRNPEFGILDIICWYDNVYQKAADDMRRQ
jgi:spore coat polysaccharide biosynthesis protein SpsF